MPYWEGKIFAVRPVLERRGKRRERGEGQVAVALDEVTRKLLDGRNFASVATLNPDGGPQTSVVRDGDTVLFSAIATRRKVIVRVIPERVNSFSP
jgi:hypothetical protein